MQTNAVAQIPAAGEANAFSFGSMQARTTRALRAARGWAPLLARITLGYVFVTSGWGKVTHLEKVTAYFTELGLPAPHFQAGLVGTTEIAGGVLVAIGLGTRLASIPLAFTMVVALLTAKRAEIMGASDLFGTIEWTYLAMLVWLVLEGSGRFSLERLFARKTNS